MLIHYYYVLDIPDPIFKAPLYNGIYTKDEKLDGPGDIELLTTYPGITPTYYLQADAGKFLLIS